MITLLTGSTKTLSAALCYVLILQLMAPVAAPQEMPARIAIVVLEGEGAINNVRQRTARDPVIQVQDENRRPLAGAAVSFTLPTEGPSGEFGNGSKTMTVMSDEQGKAAARGLKINRVPGKLQLHVNASYRGLTTKATITQFNMDVPGAKAGGGSGKIIAILALVGAGAAGGAVAALRGKSSSTTTAPAAPATPISISPGTGTIGPPR